MRAKLPIVLTLLLPSCLYITLEEHKDRQAQLGDSDTDTDASADADADTNVDTDTTPTRR